MTYPSRMVHLLLSLIAMDGRSESYVQTPRVIRFPFSSVLCKWVFLLHFQRCFIAEGVGGDVVVSSERTNLALRMAFLL